MWKVPPDTAMHSRTWMAWPWDSRIWNAVPGTNLRLCQQTIDRLIRSVLNYESVSLLVREADAASIERRFRQPASHRHQVNIVVAKYNDIWVRDTFPTFALDDNSLVAVSWNFNGWGKRAHSFGSYSDDARLSASIAQLTGATLIDSSVVAEGGAFAFDAGALVLTTRSVLLDNRRNPNRKKDQLEENVKLATGRQQICFLPGDRSEPITSGHIDSIVAFAHDRVLANWVDDEANPEFDVCDYNVRSLKSWFKEQELSREIIKIPRSSQTRAVEHCSSYINFACVNGGLIIPKFGNAAEDNYARGIMEDAFNNELKIESLDIWPIAAAGGGIHCVTQQEPLLLTQPC